MKRAKCLVVMATMSALSSAFVGAETPLSSHEASTQAALDALAQLHPNTQLYRRGDVITRVYGQAFSSGNSAIDAADRFRQDYAPVFGVDAADLRPESLLADGRHTQPILYDPQISDYRFTLVYYRQFKAGLPVFRADLRLLVRNESGYPLVLAASALHDLGDFTVGAALSNEINRAGYPQAQFAAAQASALARVPGLVNFAPPRTVIWAGIDDTRVKPRVALVFDADDGGPVNKHLFVADVQTGAILYDEDRVFRTDVTGNVSGMASQGLAADICATEVLTPMPYARVNIGATLSFADPNGNFVIPNGGTTQVDVESRVWGQWFRVFNFSGSDVLLTRTVTPPGPADFVHNAANNNEQRRAEVNAYVQTNIVRDLVLFHNPTYPTLQANDFPVWVNRTDGFCPANAWYDPGLVSLNFCLSGGGSPNTAWSSVIHHEYGHHLVQAAGSGQDQYGEGLGDVMSVLTQDDARLGLGFFGNCAAALRNADNTMQYPCSGEIHFCGQLISGAVWSLRNELLATNPTTYRDILSGLMINSILLHNGGLITPQITIDVLTIDDDDANIGNGTPHYFEIDAGFGAHNMPAPLLQLLDFQYPSGLPTFVTPDQPTVIQVNVLPITGNPVPGTGTLSYRIGTSSIFTTVPMTEITPNHYEATLPAAPCPEVIQYFVGADDAGLGRLTDPPDAPASLFEATATTGTMTVVSYDFETNPGWTVSGSVADGPWDRGVPVNCNRGDPPADFDGSGQCWLTDNSAAAACNSDVDNGATTLTSQVIDLSTMNSPQVSYARWFSNDTGGGPETDTLVVEISSDGGGSWANLETVGPTSSSPNPEVSGGWFVRSFPVAASPQFRIRFTAEDVSTQSVVEAGVDALQVFDFVCDTPCPPADGDMNGAGGTNGEDLQPFIDALLGTPTPGQICSGDFNGDSALDSGDVAGMVAAVLGL